MRSIPTDLIVSMDHGSITYLDGEDTIQKLIASVDHKVGLLEGGSNEMENLVPSCRYCNENRGREKEREILYGGGYRKRAVSREAYRPLFAES